MSKRSGCYLVRTDKPHALRGFPIIGRHFGYVGETRSFYLRERQHRGNVGSRDVYQHAAQPWSDLRPKFYRIPLANWKWLMRSVETVLIGALCPVYNVAKQPPWNIRRISQGRAWTQRKLRDEQGTAYKAFVSTARWIGWAMIWAVAVLSAHQVWSN